MQDVRRMHVLEGTQHLQDQQGQIGSSRVQQALVRYIPAQHGLLCVKHLEILSSEQVCLSSTQ